MNFPYDPLAKPGPSDWTNHLFEKIVASYQLKVLRYVQRLVGDPELSADILQETFLAVYASLARRDKFAEASNQAEFLKCIQPLIYTIARNKATDELRRRKCVRFVSINPQPLSPEGRGWQEDLDPVIEYTLTREESSLETQVVMGEALKAAIEQIGRRKLLNLFLHLDGYSYKEIGEITGESMASVKSKIFRCKQHLRQALETPA
ncbi:MAG: RNA polymerase sigma factor [Chloroflexi bacterium]|nr:RNA polymerase sigma factor [Chloroflexota bacterium]OJV95123.1 MAG: hypothetical protein BGO39_24215 [Chloroflexi bacterium 54-19]